MNHEKIAFSMDLNQVRKLVEEGVIDAYRGKDGNMMKVTFTLFPRSEDKPSQFGSKTIMLTHNVKARGTEGHRDKYWSAIDAEGNVIYLGDAWCIGQPFGQPQPQSAPAPAKNNNPDSPLPF